MPYRHPEDRIYIVMSGVFYIGLGDQFDGDKVKAYPPGSVIVLPGDTSHFHWAKSGEYITQVTAIGPLGLEYLNAKDDPRKKSSWKTLSVSATARRVTWKDLARFGVRDDHCDALRFSRQCVSSGLSHWPRIGDFRADLAQRRAS
jgi:hypothetical protein